MLYVAICGGERDTEHALCSHKQVWDAWRAARFGSIAKQQKLKRAIMRLRKGTLSRAFFKWKDRLPLAANDKRMRIKVRLKQVNRL